MSEVVDAALAALRARALPMPLSPQQRRAWQDGFNALEAMQHFGACLDLSDDRLIRVHLDAIQRFHEGGLGTHAINGAVLAGLFDCAVGAAGTLQFPGVRAGTCELSIKFIRPVTTAPVDIYAVALKRAERLAFASAELFSDGELCSRADGLVAVSSGKTGTHFPPIAV